MSYSLEDTQPRAPFEGDPINLTPTIRPEDSGSRGSCLVTVLVIAMLLAVAVVIVALSGLAGWTSGQRTANTNATATQNAAISDQFNHLPSDIAAQNLPIIDARLRWLETQAPSLPDLNGYVMTATALYNLALPTATPTPAPATEAAPTEAVTEDIAITPESNGGYDLAKILAQAQASMAASQWSDAVSYLDVILGADPNFQTQTVRTLMAQALNNYAMQLYNSNQPAEANLIVNRAEQFGPLANGLDYERYAAELFLTAQSAVGTGDPTAIHALQQVLALGPGRYYTQAQKLLYNMYVAQGDNYMATSNSCTAVGSYQQAINVLPSGVANSKLAAAQNACQNATPVATGAFTPIPGVAPVGQVSPPG
ncbi:MAG TPA: hypothetical protein VHD90_06455 [Phototrophicaceae bacterium]|nr:hypothetical protein [Phototrophicaceae bacterium]